MEYEHLSPWGYAKALEQENLWILDTRKNVNQ